MVATRETMLEEQQKPIEERKNWIGTSILDNN